MQELGALQIVNRRQVWSREDENFTPWLAENLTLLNRALNIQLEFEELEPSVGQFYADIVCRNITDNSLVVIENQWEETDHKHLGQLLTYAAGLNARTIIWIAEDFTNEHRDTLDWLNENMNDSFQFFGVKLEVIQVDNSLPAPKFTVIIKPSNRIYLWNDGNNDSHGQFWSKFREHLIESNSSLDPQGWNENSQYFGFRIGETSGVWLAAWRHRNKAYFAVNLHLKGQDAELHFDELKEQQDEIEAEFNTSLDWHRSPRHNLSIPQVGLYKNVNLTNETDWSNLFEWFRVNLEKLDEVFRSRIAHF